MCENLDGARAICGDQCPALKKDSSPLTDTSVTPDEPSAILIPMNTVSPEDVDWLWPGRIPRAMLTLIVGDPGTAKSYLLIDLLSRITVGATWPGGGQAPQGDVLHLTAEDTLPHTVRPRIDAQGGDPARFHNLSGVTPKPGALAERTPARTSSCL